MALVPIFNPAVEPVSIAEAKAHLRLEGSDEDALVASLILTSRLHIEAALGLALITQGWNYLRDAWPRTRTLNLPTRPVQSITAVRVYPIEGPAVTVPPSAYELDGHGAPARLVLSGATPAPAPGRASNGIEIAYVAGYGDTPSDVPAPIRQALLLLIAHWYENRSPFELAGSDAPIPAAISELLMPYRVVRP